MGTDENGPEGLPTRAASQDWSFPFDDTWGEGVIVYVVDSGVWNGHSELTGRVEDGWVREGLGGAATEDVCDHGTAVASLIAGTTLGVAKKATIVPIRIVDGSRCSPTPPESTTDVVPGVNWVVSDFKARTNVKAGIVNISWQLYQTDASESALSDCYGGPAQAALQRVKDVGQFVVGNTDWDDARLDLCEVGSNFGPCLTLFAPGASMVVAADKPGIDGTNHPLTRGGCGSSGTSFAAPLVSGVIAAIASTSGNLSPAEMRTTVVQKAVNPAGIGDLQESPDIMLQSLLISRTAQR
ncbi:peptidase S8/S53 domain-containing protein [Mycena pura]|uniref:Peptidase S8/S53 domain-containing protein n=1 Tax=Mycena pura TaxID=153505 RepID=A0AAD6VJX2_9AGAR|nr:peptidase S8/S53 domain-containing protein [Mycena pura]